jgi:hypothetical protein
VPDDTPCRTDPLRSTIWLTRYWPSGNKTTEPVWIPLSIAAWIAFVSSVLLSPFAPNESTEMTGSVG